MLFTFNYGSYGFSFFYDEEYSTTKTRYVENTQWTDIDIGLTSGVSLNFINIDANDIRFLFNVSGTFFVKYIAIA